MKKSVLFVLFALISVAGFSQITGWNAKVGMNFSNYTGDVADNTNLVVNAGPYFACGIAGKTKFDLGNDTERKVDTFGDDALKRFDAGLGVGVALEFGRIIAGLDGQFGLVDVEKVGNPKNMNFSIIVGYKF